MLRIPLRFLSLIACLFVAAACGPVQRRPEPDNLYWPLPPDQPRIKYLQSIYTEDDIGRVYSFFEKLFGKEYDDRLVRPYGVYARGNLLYVTDLMKRAILVFDMTAKKLSVVGGDGSIVSPAAAVRDAAGNVYVADSGSDRVFVYDAAGSYRSAYVIENSKPVALALNDALGRLYVVDRKAHRVVVLALDGEKLFSFGSQGRDDGQFNIPLGIAGDRKGDVYVLDTGNFRVQHFDPDGKFLSKFGAVGDRAGMLSNPKGIALDSDDHIYVTDAAFNNFQIFDQEGRILLAVGRLGETPGFLYLPGGIAIDDQDRIYVADQLNGRIQVFQYLKYPVP